MAEGWARALRSEWLAAFSAGTKPQELNPLAVRAMAEAGIDISRHRSKHADELTEVAFDWVITVCDAAREACPILPGRARVLHHSFDDPPRLAQAARSDTEAMAHYRRVRDEIRSFVETLPAALDDAVDHQPSTAKVTK